MELKISKEYQNLIDLLEKNNSFYGGITEYDLSCKLFSQDVKHSLTIVVKNELAINDNKTKVN